MLLTLTRPPSCARTHAHTHTHTHTHTLHHRHHHFDTILCLHVKLAPFLLWSSSTHTHTRYVPCGPSCGDPRDLSGGNAGGLPGAVKISVVGGSAADGNPRLLLWAWDPIVKVKFCIHLLNRLAGSHIRQPSSLVHTSAHASSSAVCMVMVTFTSLPVVSSCCFYVIQLTTKLIQLLLTEACARHSRHSYHANRTNLLSSPQ